ncbi:type II secretion system protein [Sutcliffiella horikoshii]|uniref:type II secretion system protein n=1 Tax=Sutcliffiella horikoshii TaxID=79883 RepID=UPI001F403389|nr:type II secretion system protein [Sutcliffiella horikoshii]MCG1022682.1 type II secretion system protein [Sutcliffiella horikoshii]
MWKNSKGFTLVEVLAALVVWMVIASVLLPGLVRMNQERKGFILDQQARFILTLELERIRTGAILFEENTVNKNGTSYALTLVEDTVPPMLCVSYTNYRSLEVERCAYVHLP